MTFDYAHVMRIASSGCDDVTLGWMLGIAPQYFAMYRQHDPELDIAINKGRATLRYNLYAKQVEKAMSGDSKMLVWLGTQHLGQTNKLEAGLANGAPSRAVELAEKNAQLDPSKVIEAFPELQEH